MARESGGEESARREIWAKEGPSANLGLETAGQEGLGAEAGASAVTGGKEGVGSREVGPAAMGPSVGKTATKDVGGPAGTRGGGETAG